VTTHDANLESEILESGLIAIQHRAPREVWALAAEAMARTTAAQFPTQETVLSHPETYQEMCEEGVSLFPERVPSNEVAEVRKYFSERVCYDGHVYAARSNATPRLPAEVQDWAYGCYMPKDILAAPLLLKLALSDQLVSIASKFLDCLPAIYSINTWWSFVRETPGITHELHRDVDDFRFLPFFIFWTDVSPGYGEMYFVRKSNSIVGLDSIFTFWDRANYWIHNRRKFDARDFFSVEHGDGHKIAAWYSLVFKNHISVVTGPAGTVIATDTSALHRGEPPRLGPRLCSWIRFGLFRNDAYHNTRAPLVRARDLDHLEIVWDDRKRHLCRFLIDFS
jgi:hypothetical protein